MRAGLLASAACGLLSSAGAVAAPPGNVTVGSASNAIGSLIGLLHTSNATVTNSFGSGTVTAGPGSTNVGGQTGESEP